MKPKVTTGVCVKNNASTIREAIESIIHQDFPHELMEVIFVDDGSDDGTLSVIEGYASKMDMRVKVFHHEWKGLGASRNVVVENAGGDFIVWVDGDMVLPRDHVRKQVEFMEHNSQVGIAKARRGIILREKIVAALENIPFSVYDSKDGSLDSNLPGTGGSIYRVETIRQVGGFDNHIRSVGEDSDAAYRVKAAGWLLRYTKAVFYERGRQTWRELWKQYFSHGYGLYDLYRKNKNIFSPYKMVPMASFVAGALYIPDAYRLTRRKLTFLLPLHFAFKMTAWCLGFAKGKSDFS